MSIRSRQRKKEKAMRPIPGKWSRQFVVGLTVTSALASAALVSSEGASEGPFLDANAAAMGTMMTGMAVKPTGHVDQDFAAMMIPHHQGAIDMAKAELQYGHDEILRRIAQGIIVEQQQEIAAMQSAVAQSRKREAARANPQSEGSLQHAPSESPHR